MGHHFPCPVTTMVTRRVRPGREDDYERWLHGVAAVARDYPGHQSVAILGPHGAPPVEYTAIFTFASTDDLRRWMRSGDRRRWLDRAEELTLDDGDVQSLTGLEPWFVLPDRAVSQAPPRWKMALLTTLGVWPMLTVLAHVLGPLIGDWPHAARIGLSLAVGIPLMTWGIMPSLTRLFFSWLYPEPPSRSRQEPARSVRVSASVPAPDRSAT